MNFLLFKILNYYQHLPVGFAFHLRDGQVLVCVERDVDGDGRLEEAVALVGPDHDARRQGADAVGDLLILRRRGHTLALRQPGLIMIGTNVDSRLLEIYEIPPAQKKSISLGCKKPRFKAWWDNNRNGCWLGKEASLGSFDKLINCPQPGWEAETHCNISNFWLDIYYTTNRHS